MSEGKAKKWQDAETARKIGREVGSADEQIKILREQLEALVPTKDRTTEFKKLCSVAKANVKEGKATRS